MTRDRSRSRNWYQWEQKGANSCREAAEISDVVINMIRDILQIDEVIFSKDWVWEGVKEGSFIIITRSIGPSYCQNLYEKAKEKNVRVADCAVSGGMPTVGKAFIPDDRWRRWCNSEMLATFWGNGRIPAPSRCYRYRAEKVGAQAPLFHLSDEFDTKNVFDSYYELMKKYLPAQPIGRA